MTDEPALDSSTDPELSIIVPTFRGASRLPALLDALAEQAVGTPRFDVVVVVDGEEDGSAQLLEEETRIVVRTVVLPENRGRVSALNAGFAAARGRVLVRCDDDLVPGPRFVARHALAHAGGDPHGVVGLYLNQYEATAYAEAYGYEADRRFREDAYSASPELRWRYWAGNCSLPRTLWEEIGPYDPRYRLYGWEDVDYGRRLAAAGYEVVLDPQLETVHRVASVTTAARARRAARSGAARHLFEETHGRDLLPLAVPPWTPWNVAVRGAALLAMLARPARVGATVDRILPAVPRGLGRKLVALAVEGSALNGYRHPDRAQEVF